MNPTSPDPTPHELAELYAAGALTPAEAHDFESRVRSGEEAFVKALLEVKPAMERLLSIADPVAPPAAVRASLIARLNTPETSSDEDPFHHEDDEPEPVHAGGGAGITILHAATGRWKRTGLPGVHYRSLLTDRKANRRTFMLRMDPGAQLPTTLMPASKKSSCSPATSTSPGRLFTPTTTSASSAGARHGVPPHHRRLHLHRHLRLRPVPHDQHARLRLVRPAVPLRPNLQIKLMRVPNAYRLISTPSPSTG